MYLEYFGYDSILAIHATMYLTRLVAVCVTDAFLSRDLLSNTVVFASSPGLHLRGPPAPYRKGGSHTFFF